MADIAKIKIALKRWKCCGRLISVLESVGAQFALAVAILDATDWPLDSNWAIAPKNGTDILYTNLDLKGGGTGGALPPWPLYPPFKIQIVM